MPIRSLKYHLVYNSSLNIDNGTQAYTTQNKYSLANKVDFSYQNTCDLLAGIENTITIPGLQNIQMISWTSIDPVSLAMQLDNQLTPQPIYTSPALFGVLKFSDVLPLFVPTFIRFKSLVNTSVELIIVGNR